MSLVYFTFYEATFGEAADKRLLYDTFLFYIYTVFQDGFAIPDESEIPEEFWGSRTSHIEHVFMYLHFHT